LVISGIKEFTEDVTMCYCKIYYLSWNRIICPKGTS